MALHSESDFILGGVTSDFCMKVIGENTVSVLAAIKTRNTGKRKGPPACGNGFETAELAFAKGHVIGLEIGGSDNSYNVVPQFEHWQGKPNGAWRMMEIDVAANYGGNLILIEMAYERVGPAQQGAECIAKFQDDRFIDWTDTRIPSKFSVKILAGPFSPTSLATEAAYDAKIIALNAVNTVKTYEFDLGTTRMSEPDRTMYIVQAGLDIAQPTLARTQSFATHFMQEGAMDEVRNKLKRKRAISAVEAYGVRAADLIQAGQNITIPKLKKKRKAGEKAGLVMASEDDLFNPT